MFGSGSHVRMLPTVVHLGQVAVVGATHQADVLHRRRAAVAERDAVVEFEPPGGVAPLAVLVEVAAAASVAFAGPGASG